ncbi:hypothetical protein [Phocaeicola massiliensis]|uniref:hypothetical protein n=1 Tax=Phocaeicola massiliensis TaxID=204516 RepID=UPI0032EF51E3
MKKIKCKDGVERIYVNVAVIERKEKSQFGHTHFITCSPKKEERVEGRNYICGDLKEFVPQGTSPSPEDINNAPSVSDDDLPF